jgi:hypothetical protein
MSAAAGEALPGFATAIRDIKRHSACLAQRSTGLPKKRISFFCGLCRAVAREKTLLKKKAE